MLSGLRLAKSFKASPSITSEPRCFLVVLLLPLFSNVFFEIFGFCFCSGVLSLSLLFCRLGSSLFNVTLRLFTILHEIFTVFFRKDCGLGFFILHGLRGPSLRGCLLQCHLHFKGPRCRLTNGARATRPVASMPTAVSAPAATKALERRGAFKRFMIAAKGSLPLKEENEQITEGNAHLRDNAPMFLIALLHEVAILILRPIVLGRNKFCKRVKS